jgi:Domain of unknown function (DUF5597)/Beta-galactosidase
MRNFRRFLFAIVCAFGTVFATAQQAPVRVDTASGQLLVDGKPYVIFGGELGNSSAGTAAQADEILPRMAHMHLNTVLMPVAWEQIEPVEGKYDFSILDHWIDVARAQNLHLVPLWFGSWKNAFSEYAPAWVKADTKRFLRARAANGTPTEILSTFGGETQRADGRAFAALLTHLKEKDAAQHTVLMIQVENEVGFLGSERDRSEEANRAFAEAIPALLREKLVSRGNHLSPELAEHFRPAGKTWYEVFGPSANEVFMAWRYATFVDAVAEAGKKQYDLPMYMNVQLPAYMERAGDYPSGGPHPYYLDVYRATAQHIDFYSPDIYWPEFAYWANRYRSAGIPVFVPEARLDVAPYNALYAYGAAQAFGFCPFGIDSLRSDEEPLIAQVYGALESFDLSLSEAQRGNLTRGIVLYANSPRGTQAVSLGGYLFQATLSRAWNTGALESQNGALLLVASGPDEFFVIGTGLTVKISRNPDADAKVAGIASIDEVVKDGARWKVVSRLNGDQSNQGRQLMLDSQEVRIYRVRLYAAER